MILDQVTDPRNIGAILRSARAFGTDALILTSRNAPDETGALAKAAAGALEDVPLVRVNNLARALDALKEHFVTLAGLEAGADTDIKALADTRHLGLVMGSEGSGLRRLTRKACDVMAAIDMADTSESLNVSVAAAIALYATRFQGEANTVPLKKLINVEPSVQKPLQRQTMEEQKGVSYSSKHLIKNEHTLDSDRVVI